MAKQTMIGAYGQWAAGLVPDELGELSFRNAKFNSSRAWSRKALAKVREVLAQPPADPWKPKAKVVRRCQADGLLFEELAWQLPFGPATRAIFIKPAGVKGRLPAIVALHDHGGQKFFGADKITRLPGVRQHPVMRAHQEHYYGGVAWANEVARRGYAVLVPDVFTFASRRVLISDVPKNLAGGFADPTSTSPTASAIENYNRWAGGHEHIVAKSLFAAGTTWPGVFLYDDQRAVDYLCSRPDVDVDRIGCGGLSGGGLRTCMLTGLDERIKVGVAVGFMTTWRDLVLDKCFTHTWMCYVPGLPRLLDWPEVIGLRVPTPVMVLNDIHDNLFSLAEMKRADRILGEVYAKAGARERYRCAFHPGPHKFDLAMQGEAFAWFDQWLK
jgi:dienelactone hydrolase